MRRVPSSGRLGVRGVVFLGLLGAPCAAPARADLFPLDFPLDMPRSPTDGVDASAGDDGRWPTWIGLVVVAVGGAVVGGYAVARRRPAPRA